MREPATARQLRARLRKLKLHRKKRKKQLRAEVAKGVALTPRQRTLILAKTKRRCHICGGKIQGAWQADHVLARSAGGAHAVDNYLPSHALCNNYRWDYSEKEFQLILRLGVWLAQEMRTETAIGVEASEKFARKERSRQH